MNIGNTLCWDNYVEKVCKQLNTICYTMRIIQKYTNDETVKTVYHSTFKRPLRYRISMEVAKILEECLLLKKGPAYNA